MEKQQIIALTFAQRDTFVAYLKTRPWEEANDFIVMLLQAPTGEVTTRAEPSEEAPIAG